MRLFLGRSRIRRRLLAELVLTEERLLLAELARRADTTAGKASRELSKLVEAGLAERVVSGRQVY